jgi:prepilin-type N-terminal cleavage/methylation domain-containing protein/prepilin-type processing-associated H-X9-DG protein
MQQDPDLQRGQARGRRVDSRPAFTLIELLVVISIIALLIALLLPAVQVVRESASRTQCSNNLKNLALGCLAHHQRTGFLPTGGWGWSWNGDPDRGITSLQPGGWGFNVLPYVEQENLYRLGAGLPPGSSQKRAAIAQRISTPLAVFNCPTRRAVRAYTNSSHSVCFDADQVPALGRSDFAANAGDEPFDEIFAGPPTLAEGDRPNYPWRTTDDCTGVCFQRSEIRLTDIPRGTSNTFLLGEKYLNPDSYTNGQDSADNENLYTGFNNDNFRTTHDAPLRDRKGYADTKRFGSAHMAGVNMVYCDGSVHHILFSVDPKVFIPSGSRR